MKKFFLSLIYIVSLPAFLNDSNAAENFFEPNYSQANYSQVKLKSSKNPFLNFSKKLTSETFNRIASLNNEYRKQENNIQEAINKCRLLKNEISYVDQWYPGPHITGLTVRTNNFSVYKFTSFKDEYSLPIGQSCREVGRYEFNKVYSYRERQIEFFKSQGKCVDSKGCISIFAYTKEYQNQKVKKNEVFYVNSKGRLVIDKFSAFSHFIP